MTSTKYIGMDVHKESISIAVRNAAGKVVMECVIETKASMILQFIDGLRGDLQVTFEEGISAAWLYDLLKPHVTKLVVCDPRKNKSMREGNQNDKIDARRLAELLRLDHLTPVYHGEHGLRTLKELVRSYLTITKDLARVMSRVKAILSKLGHSLYRQAGVCITPSCRVAREDQRTRSAPTSGVLLPAARCAAIVAPGSAAGSAGGEQEAQGMETTLPDSLDWPDPGGGVAGHPADAASFSHQAAVVELRWFSHRDAQQRRSPACPWAAGTLHKKRLGARPQSQLQSRSKEPV